MNRKGATLENIDKYFKMVGLEEQGATLPRLKERYLALKKEFLKQADSEQESIAQSGRKKIQNLDAVCGKLASYLKAKDKDSSVSLNQQTSKGPSEKEATPAKQKVARKIADHVTNAVGLEKIDGLDIKGLFSEVFTTHTSDEVEEYFTVGTAKTTPNLIDLKIGWPKPWVFFRAFTATLLVFALFVFAWYEFENLNLIPGLIMMGSFAIPFATLTFFFETNIVRNISLYQVVKLVFLSGVISLIYSLFLFESTDLMSLLGASSAGPIEEFGKILALLLVINNTKYRYTLNGLLLGAAVGTGFAAFESAGYALRALLMDDDTMMIHNIVMRGIMAPAGHIVWTALAAAALWKVKGDKAFTFDMLKDFRFVRVFLFVVALHMIWNMEIGLPFYGEYLALGFLAWVAVFAYIQEGLKQLQEEKRKALQGTKGAV